MPTSGAHTGGFLGIAPTEKRGSRRVWVSFRPAGGRIVERRGTHDLMGLLKEPGVAPEKTAPAGVR